MASISFLPRFKVKDLARLPKPRIVHASGPKRPTLSQQEGSLRKERK